MLTHDSDIAAYANRIINFRDGRITGDERMKRPLQADSELLQFSRG